MKILRTGPNLSIRGDSVSWAAGAYFPLRLSNCISTPLFLLFFWLIVFVNSFVLF